MGPYLITQMKGGVALTNRRNPNAFKQAVRVRLFEPRYEQPHEFDEQTRWAINPICTSKRELPPRFNRAAAARSVDVDF